MAALEQLERPANGEGMPLNGVGPRSHSDVGQWSTQTEFDLRAANVKLDAIKHSRVAGGVIVIVGIIGVELLFLLLLLRGMAEKTVSDPQIIALVGTTVFAAVIVWTAVSGIHRMRAGPLSLSITSKGFELRFASSPTVRLEWTDSRLEFMLDDLTGARTEDLAADTPYFLVTRGTFSSLTGEAYRAVLAAARDRGLSEQTEAGSRWFFPSSSFPRVRYHFRSTGRRLPQIRDPSGAIRSPVTVDDGGDMTVLGPSR